MLSEEQEEREFKENLKWLTSGRASWISVIWAIPLLAILCVIGFPWLLGMVIEANVRRYKDARRARKTGL